MAGTLVNILEIRNHSTSNSRVEVMVTALLVFMVVEPTLTWQLYRPESVTLRGEKEYVDDV